MTSTINKADPLFTLVIAPRFYMFHAEVTNHYPACVSLEADNNTECETLTLFRPPKKASFTCMSIRR